MSQETGLLSPSHFLKNDIRGDLDLSPHASVSDANPDSWCSFPFAACS